MKKFDPDHTVEGQIQKEKDKVWERLKHVDPKLDYKEEINKSFARISQQLNAMAGSTLRMEESLDRMGKTMLDFNKALGKAWKIRQKNEKK